MAKVHVKTGDLVKLLSGDDQGKTGKILEVRPKTGQVFVDGVNIQKKHARPTRTNPQGGIVERPGPVEASNVALVCPHCNKATRYTRERDTSGMVRGCNKCGRNID